MLFNSVEFLFFLLIVYFLYWILFKKTVLQQNILLLIASYIFYAWWSWKFLGLLVLSTLLDFVYAFFVVSPNKQKAKFFLVLSIINNLGILAIFKYYNFFSLQLKHLFNHFGVHLTPVILHIGLPIGISFYTFHGMSYVFDIYRGRQKPIKNFVEYAVFVSFFPLLVAGPIERANHLLPQIQNKRSFSYTQSVQGCRLFLWGMFKKVVVADSLAVIVNNTFSNYSSYNAVNLIIAAIAFSFQIYCDFSGYSDIAIGSAKLLGFELLSNFKFPYFSRDVAEFWRRWHISLSSWFRDYLYIPLGGSKNGKLKAVRNTFIIFLVSGFWHGASWNFIVWGFIHACLFLPLLLANRNRRHKFEVVAAERNIPSLREILQLLSTFILVTLAWIFFRADTITTAINYITRIFSDLSQYPRQLLDFPVAGKVALIYITPLVLIDWWLRHDERVLKVPKFGRPVIYILLSVLIIFGIGRKSNFIYFQF